MAMQTASGGTGVGQVLPKQQPRLHPGLGRAWPGRSEQRAYTEM